jgi:hypothetical protein
MIKAEATEERAELVKAQREAIKAMAEGEAALAAIVLSVWRPRPKSMWHKREEAKTCPKAGIDIAIFSGNFFAAMLNIAFV